jgi:preprotein translocase subunit SecA
LRERLEPLVSVAAESTMQRGLCFAIVDEADSVLVDDAKTPFVLSRPVAEAGSKTEYTVALGIARRLRRDEHFSVSPKGVRFSEDGLARLDELTSALPNRWRNVRFRKEIVQQALMALHFFVRDKHYVVKDGAVVLIDENTGRPVPDRSLSKGLHQMVQIKERSQVTEPTAVTARISYQSFFGRYLRIGGMTGTGWEVRRELGTVYGLGVRRVPTHALRRVEDLGLRIFASLAEKYDCLVEVVGRVHREGRPILIGTRSVAESEQLQRVLEKHGFAVAVLNANQDARESEVVARAGLTGSIVVATNMAGRGTDIPLGEGVAERGGLHVICVHLNDSPRIDRQLFGRCGRQGDPGSCESILSLEDDVFIDTLPDAVLNGLRSLASGSRPLWRLIAPRVASVVQAIRSHRAGQVRAAVRRSDERLDSLLSFASNRS